MTLLLVNFERLMRSDELNITAIGITSCDHCECVASRDLYVPTNRSCKDRPYC